MKAKVIVGASYAYACISTPTRSLDVLLHAGRAPAVSLRETVEELREKARALQDRADFIESHIELFV